MVSVTLTVEVGSGTVVSGSIANASSMGICATNDVLLTAIIGHLMPSTYSSTPPSVLGSGLFNGCTGGSCDASQVHDVLALIHLRCEPVRRAPSWRNPGPPVSVVPRRRKRRLRGREAR